MDIAREIEQAADITPPSERRRAKVKASRTAAVGSFIISAIILLLVCVLASSVRAGLLPATLTFTNFTSESTISQASDATYFENASVLLTNCVVYAGSTTNSSRQNLTNCTVSVALGNTSTSFTYTGYVILNTAGTYWALCTVPADMSTVYVQTTLVDTNAAVTNIMEWKKIKAKDAL